MANVAAHTTSNQDTSNQRNAKQNPHSSHPSTERIHRNHFLYLSRGNHNYELSRRIVSTLPSPASAAGCDRIAYCSSWRSGCSTVLQDQGCQDQHTPGSPGASAGAVSLGTAAACRRCCCTTSRAAPNPKRQPALLAQGRPPLGDAPTFCCSARVCRIVAPYVLGSRRRSMPLQLSPLAGAVHIHIGRCAVLPITACDLAIPPSL
jgi:hypothetical protein